MEYKKLELSNGIRVIAVKKPTQPLVVVRVFVKAGSRYDDENPGLAHLLEHLFFSSAILKKNGDIYYRIESLGGKIDGNTTKEYLDISLVILKENFRMGLQLLSNILINPHFTKKKVENEKDIVIEEIKNSYSKTKILWDVFAQTIWKESPLRNPILGTIDSIREISLENVLDFYIRYYTGKNIVLSVIGDIDYKELEEMMESLFARINSGQRTTIDQSILPTFNTTKRIHIEKKSIQTQLMVGYPAVSIRSPYLSGFKLINKILGNGATSRLYRRLRCDLHLVYSLTSVLSIYEETGYFAVWANYNDEKSSVIFRTILKEFDLLKRDKIPEKELDLAKIRYRRDLLINFETDYSLAGFLGIEELLTEKIKTFADIITGINSIDSDDLFCLCNKYFMDNNRFTVSIGKKLSKQPTPNKKIIGATNNFLGG